MAITEHNEISKVEFIGPFRHMIVETKTIFLKDGVEIEDSARYRRDSMTCGDFAMAIKLNVRDLATVAWNDEIMAAYNDYVINHSPVLE